jgi:hypothetical protein
MSLQGASLVVRLEKPAETMAEEAAAVEEKEKCILQYAQNVELLQKFRFCLKMTDPFTVATAFRRVGKNSLAVIA